MCDARVNPYYLAYCNAHGRAPDQQAEHDRRAWTGGRMAGFIVWIDGQWSAFYADHGEKRPLTTVADRDAFAAWLAAKYGTTADLFTEAA